MVGHGLVRGVRIMFRYTTQALTLEAVPSAAHTEWIRLSIGRHEMTSARSLAEVIHIERGYCAARPRERHLDRIFRPPGGVPLL